MQNKRRIVQQHARTIMMISASVLGILFMSSLVYFMYDIRVTRDNIIVEQLAELAKIFNNINEKCKIVSFAHEKNYIDFLNVKTFSGSEVGPMNLMYPEKWEGPYVSNNFTVQGKLYCVVKTHKGYYIVPGDGVRLANGKTLGKEIKIDYHADIEALARDPKALWFKGKGLAIKLHINPERMTHTLFAEPLSTIEDL
jgi:hypothetical protein